MKMKLLTTADAAKHLHVSKRTLVNWRERGVGPRFMALGGKRLYSQADLDSWLERCWVDPEASGESVAA